MVCGRSEEIRIRKLWFQHLVSIVEDTGVVVPASGKCIREIMRERSVFPVVG